MQAVKQRITFLMAATLFWVPNAGTCSAQSQAAAGNAASRDVALYRGRTFLQWKNSLESDLDPDFRDLALKALGAFGANGRASEAVEAIRPYLRSEEVGTARHAINSIGRCGSEAAPILAGLLEDSSYKHRDYAAISLVVNAGAAAKPYVPLLMDMAQSEDDRTALAAGRAMIMLGAENDGAMTALHATLCRFAKPGQGVANNLNANALLRAFEKSRLSASAIDRLAVQLLQSDNTSEKDLGGQLLIRYASNDRYVREALTSEYATQLQAENVRRLEPSFHDLADNPFLLTCHLGAFSEAEQIFALPKQPLLQFLRDLKNMRLNFVRRQGQKRPRGDLNPAAHPGTVSFLVRLIEQMPASKYRGATLRQSIDLLGDFGEEAKEAMPSLARVQENIKEDIARFPELSKVLQQAIDSIAGEQE